ncbi:hypothetical protein TNCT_462651 [Trichonephila clavata]|uniref:Uncharacterized protein n=1 Tax=Trichonephila clavata TaxID=2740835 RepID=A0A8X6I6K4_TRICU|nr:hypothetical protein TNCT_462651 [Trichonephila clavata]
MKFLALTPEKMLLFIAQDEEEKMVNGVLIIRDGRSREAINEFVNRIDLWMRHKVPHFPYQLPEEMDEPEKRTEDDQDKK